MKALWETAAGSLIRTLGFARASSFPSLYLARLSHCHTTRLPPACNPPSSVMLMNSERPQVGWQQVKGRAWLMTKWLLLPQWLGSSWGGGGSSGSVWSPSCAHRGDRGPRPPLPRPCRGSAGDGAWRHGSGHRWALAVPGPHFQPLPGALLWPGAFWPPKAWRNLRMCGFSYS